MTARGAVSTGHPITTAAAAEILRDGGNAFDAILAAHFTACVVEPVLASLGGGGYLLAEPEGSPARVYDFFARTPRRKPVGEVDFYPISADFGPATQEFHVGLASVAAPGAVRGSFAIHRDLGSLPMTRLVEPAVRAAREGVALNSMQSYIMEVVSPIYLATPGARNVYGSPAQAGKTLQPGESLVQPELADTLEALAREGEGLFYLGEISDRIAQLCRDRGLLTREDLADFSVIVSEPLRGDYRDAQVLINPPPSSGGILIAFMLALRAQFPVYPPGSSDGVGLLAQLMGKTEQARRTAENTPSPDFDQLLANDLLARYRDEVQGYPLCSRGTTQMSVVDARGNLASMTVSNGEGCGELLPGTGIMLNNILGEEDINPGGFFNWQPGARMTSMMAPAILHTPRGRAVLGSGGSNRLRTAIAQVILNLVDHDMAIETAVTAPRIHLENGLLSLEPGACEGPVESLSAVFDACDQWPDKNLFFGGVHSVWMDASGELRAVADARRSGAGTVVE